MIKTNDEEEKVIYSNRAFLSNEPNTSSIAAVSAVVTLTTISSGNQYLDVDLTIVDNSGDKVWFGFWEWGTGNDVDELAVLRTLRNEIDKLIVAVEGAHTRYRPHYEMRLEPQIDESSVVMQTEKGAIPSSSFIQWTDEQIKEAAQQVADVFNRHGGER